MYTTNYTSGTATNFGREYHIYGSTRLGMLSLTNSTLSNLYLDKNTKLLPTLRSYEIGNHLGNVMVVVSGLKRGVDTDNNGKADLYYVNVLIYNYYYPFGGLLPGRTKNIGSYRYGFNGKENDKDVKMD